MHNKLSEPLGAIDNYHAHGGFGYLMWNHSLLSYSMCDICELHMSNSNLLDESVSAYYAHTRYLARHLSQAFVLCSLLISVYPLYIMTILNSKRKNEGHC